MITWEKWAGDRIGLIYTSDLIHRLEEEASYGSSSALAKRCFGVQRYVIHLYMRKNNGMRREVNNGYFKNSFCFVEGLETMLNFFFQWLIQGIVDRKKYHLVFYEGICIRLYEVSRLSGYGNLVTQILLKYIDFPDSLFWLLWHMIHTIDWIVWWESAQIPLDSEMDSIYIL